MASPRTPRQASTSLDEIAVKAADAHRAAGGASSWAAIMRSTSGRPAGALFVSIGPAPNPPFVVESDTEIRTVAPGLFPGQWDVTVATPSGFSFETPAD